MPKHLASCQEGCIQGELDTHRTNRLRVREGRDPPGRVNRGPPPNSGTGGAITGGHPGSRAAREPGLCG
ncbi:hypothetical protein Slala03_80230 [Streptomyces lavendulae subsp. lavendulae]|nr:hypothetical protein Slala03_80230 [Streptomyces lavendulae subsp. lavendulae]